MAQFTVFRSSESGAPTLSGTAGTLVSVLDACLVNGYTASVSGITRSGAVATVTTTTAHGFYTGNQVVIAGADQAEYNGTFSVTVTSATVFTITVSGTPATPATGTMTWKKGPAGWTKSFSGTNKAAYRGAGNQLYLRVQDDAPGAGGAREARVTGYETMSDVDTGTGPFPTAAQGVGGIAMVVARKSVSLDGTARPWIVVADNRTVYVFILAGDIASTYWGWCFGEFYSFLNNDSYRTMIIARSAENSGAASNVERFTDNATSLTGSTAGHFFARGHTGLGSSVNFGKHQDLVKGSNFIGTIPFTNPSDGGLYLSPVWIHDAITTPVNGVRGRMRGIWAFCHALGSVADGDTFSGVGELAGRTFLCVKQFQQGGGVVGIVVVETSNTVETN